MSNEGLMVVGGEQLKPKEGSIESSERSKEGLNESVTKRKDSREGSTAGVANEEELSRVELSSTTDDG